MGAYLVIQVANKFQVFLSTFQEYYPISVLGHEQTQRQSQFMLHQHLL